MEWRADPHHGRIEGAIVYGRKRFAIDPLRIGRNQRNKFRTMMPLRADADIKVCWF
jgi:hypothetical protein